MSTNYDEKHELCQRNIKDEPKTQAASDNVPRNLIVEFGGWLGALLLMGGFLALNILLLMVCNSAQCSHELPDLQKYQSVSTYLDFTSLMGYTGYLLLLGTLCALPFGGKKISGVQTKEGKLDYVLNSLFSTVILLVIALGLEIAGLKLADYVIDHLFHLLIASYTTGLAITFFVYFKSFTAPQTALNPDCIGKGRIYGFFAGRELNPRICALDLKMFTLTLSCTGSIILDLAILYKSLDPKLTPIELDKYILKVHLHPTLIVFAVIHLVYLLYPLVYEGIWLTSYEIVYEGFGFISVLGYTVWPVMASSIIKYIFDFNVHLSTGALVYILILFFVGWTIFLGANVEKNTFKQNPNDPTVANLHTITTSHGNKLLASGYFGIVRHPNHFGDFLMNCSFIPFVYNVPPVWTVVAVLLFLIHRVYKLDIRCKYKYGKDWDKYCRKVKYSLVPLLY